MYLGYLLCFILACYGGANGIVYSSLLSTPRNWIVSRSVFFGKLITCPMCVGFWIGVMFSMSGIGPTAYYVIESYSPFFTLADGFVGSASAWILHLLLYEKMVGK